MSSKSSPRLAPRLAPRTARLVCAAGALALLAACGNDQTAGTEPALDESQTAIAQEAMPDLDLPPMEAPAIPPPSAHVALNPGVYVSDDVALELTAGRFALEAPELEAEASGRYEVADGVLVLHLVEGESGELDFPVSCMMSRAGPAIRLHEPQAGSCQQLAGLDFIRRAPMGSDFILD